MWHRRLETFLALVPMALTGVLGQQLKTSSTRPATAPAPSTLMQFDRAQPQNSSNSLAPTSSEPPATIPSIAPFYERSDAPSNSPTSFPSLKCHDVASYRSPLNEFRCEAHAGTDCFQWRFLGLNPDEVETLIDSCPISCEIECNSLLNFEVVLSFVMLHVDNFLAPETTEIMQEVSTDYLTKYSRPLLPESRFTLYGVELRKQSIANSGTEGDEPNANSGLRHRILRKSHEDVPALAVSVAFRGFALYLNYTTVQAILHEGIFSTGYSKTLQFTDDLTFRNVEIVELNYTLGEAQPSPQIDDTKDSSLSGGAIFACVFASFVIIGAGGGFVYLYRRHYHQKLENDVSFEGNEFGSELNSPCSSAKSPIRDVVSFDSIIRLISSGRSGSESPTDLEGDSTDQKSRQSKDVDSKASSEIVDKEDEEDDHPYANLIPPMIVYDNIDLDEEPADFETITGNVHVKNVVPSRKVTASKLFAESLRVENGATLNESTYENVLSLIESDKHEPKHRSIDQKPSPLWVGEDRKSPVSFSSEDSCCSPRDYRKTLSDSYVDIPSQRSSPLRSLGAHEEREQWPESSERNPSRCNSPIAPPKCYRTTSVDALDTIEADGEQPKGIMRKAVRSFGGSSPWKISAVPRCISPSQVASSNSVDGQETMETDGEVPKGKMSKATRGFGSSPWKKTSVSRCTSPSLSPDKLSSLSRKSSRCSDSDHPTDYIDPGGSKGVQLVFQAPRKGKLGLVIQCLDNLGPIVTQVKDYSPLLGQVLQGDRIVDIDGMSTSGMSLRDVTGLMGGKVAQSRWAPSVFRIVVWRQKDDLLKRLEATASVSGYLLSDSPVATERHNSRVPPRSTSTPPRIRGSTPPPILRGRGALTPPPPSIPLLGATSSRHRRSSSLNRAMDQERMKSSTPPPHGRRRSSSLTPRSDSREDSESRRLPN